MEHRKAKFPARQAEITRISDQLERSSDVLPTGKQAQRTRSLEDERRKSAHDTHDVWKELKAE